MKNWDRDRWFDETGLPWINPSPNMRNLLQATLYPGVGAIEGTNVSVGRGTDTPFEQIGAPWIDGVQLADTLNARGDSRRPLLSGPLHAVVEQVRERGVPGRVHGGDRPAALRPVRLGVELAAALSALYGVEIRARAGRAAVRLARRPGPDPRRRRPRGDRVVVGRGGRPLAPAAGEISCTCIADPPVRRRFPAFPTAAAVRPFLSAYIRSSASSRPLAMSASVCRHFGAADAQTDPLWNPATVDDRRTRSCSSLPFRRASFRGTKSGPGIRRRPSGTRSRLADMAGQERRDLPQGVVAGGVAERVVDALEPVDVEEHQRQRCSVAPMQVHLVRRSSLRRSGDCAARSASR